MKKILTFCALSMSLLCVSQSDERISTLDFVQVLDDNYEEAIYYYQNNWNILREWAVKESYIASYEFMQTQPSQEQPFHFILMTTYSNKEQFDKREENFAILIERRGGRRLKNELQPSEFRKIIYSKESSSHGFTIR